MPNKKINQLDSRVGASLTDLMLIGDPTSGTSFKLTASELATLLNFVPYVGATANLNLGEYEIKAGQLTLDTTPTGTAAVATTRWNDSAGVSETTLKGGNVIVKNGIDLVARVVNKVSPNTTLIKAAYQAVKISGAQGQRLAVGLAQANNDANSADTIGLVTETIATNQEGFIITVGQLEGINTTGSLQGETWADGDVLYLSPTTAGAITKVKPTGAGHIVVIGYVEYAHQINGKIYVKVMNGWELDELHDVDIVTPLNNQVLTYESATSLWKNKTVATALGYTPVPTTRTLTINGTAFDLSADRSWTISAGISGSGATGQVAYWNGTSSQTGSNNLFWDAANSRLGIGTNAPTATLDVIGSAYVTGNFGFNGQIRDNRDNGIITQSISSVTVNRILTIGNATYLNINFPNGNLLVGTTTDNGNRLQVTGNGYFSGNVGIGTTSPGTAFHVVGDVTLQGNDILLGNSGQVTYARFVNAGANNLYAESGGTLSFGSNGNINHLFIGTTGNILVGTTVDSGYKLDVNGTARVSGNLFGSSFFLNRTNSGGYYSGTSDNFGFWYTGSVGNISLANAQPIVFSTANTERLRLDSSGTLGLGVTPSAWSITPALQVVRASIYNQGDDGTYITSNGYFNAGWKYIGAFTATQYIMLSGQHRWLTAPSGSANAAITFTQAMTLTANGRLLLGTATESTFLLDVNGTGRFTGKLLTTSFEDDFGTSNFVRRNNNQFWFYSSNVVQGGIGAASGTNHRSIILQGVYSGYSTNAVYIGTSSTAGTYFENTYMKLGGLPATYTDTAILELESINRGFLPPRMTTTQKNAIATPAAGLQVYDTTLNQMSYYNGTTWVNF